MFFSAGCVCFLGLSGEEMAEVAAMFVFCGLQWCLVGFFCVFWRGHRGFGKPLKTAESDRGLQCD